MIIIKEIYANAKKSRLFTIMLNSKILPREIFQKREELGMKNSIKMLMEIIEKDKDDGRRKSAIKYLGLINNNSTILKNECFEILENILISDDNISLKCEAANSLSFLGLEDILRPLKWTLEQSQIESELKISCFTAIANAGFLEKELDSYIKEMDNESQDIRECVISQLLKLKPKKLVKHLLLALNEDDYSENHKIEVLKLIAYELTETKIFDKQYDSQKIKYPEILPDLIQNKKTLLKIIINVLRDDILDNILKILYVLGQEIHQELVEYVNNEDFIIKKNAIKLIGKLRIKDGVNVLVDNLDNIYDDVSKASIKSLGEIGEISVVSKLLNILNIEDMSFEYIDLDMKWYVLDAITKIYLKNKNPNFDILYSTLKSKNDILIESVAYLLGEIGYEEFTAPLLRLLSKRNLDIRKNAAIALGKIGNKKAIEFLISIIEDKNNYWLLKKIATDAIYNIYLKNIYAISKDPQDKRFFTQQTEKIINYLNQTNDYYKVKLSVVKILEDFGGKTSINALLKQVNDFHRIVRISSSKAIKKIEKRLEEKK
ncbi:MAG: HEAT repeat domain-containing protein [Promethearchaeota archaeon]